MDAATQGVMILATFSLAHERVLEFLRWWMTRLPTGPRKVVDTLTSGAWAWIPGVALALVTNANLIDVFRVGSDQQPVFIAHYLHSVPDSGRSVIGCCLMGLTVTLGSSFWHDLAKGLIAARAQLGAPTATAPAAQATSTVVVATPVVTAPVVAPAEPPPVMSSQVVPPPVVPPPVSAPEVVAPVVVPARPEPTAIGGVPG
jgi:hypothetical protein